jgi:hypothetical protein
VNRHEFLQQLHRVYRPRNYLEIGIYRGHSLTLSHVPTIGIDPMFSIENELKCDIQLVRSTSDEFFDRKDPLRHLRPGRNPFRALARKDPRALVRDPRLDMSFIDGMHLFEYALRDFRNVERHSAWSSVAVFDDMLPRTADEAARERITQYWTGDVYKVILVLRRFRPDLVVIPVNTHPTGTAVVLGADPANRVLHDRYEEIFAEYVVDDPQDVPEDILTRKTAVEPEVLLRSDFWPQLVRARNLGRGRGSWSRLRSQVESLVPA